MLLSRTKPLRPLDQLQASLYQPPLHPSSQPPPGSRRALRPPPRKRAFAFVLLGMNQQQRQQSLLSPHTLLGVSNALIKRTHITKGGNLIIEPIDDAARITIQGATLPPGLTLKPLNGESRSATVSPFVVLRGVQESIETATIETALGLKCKRLLSSANEGKPTQKVKLLVLDEARRKEILEKGVNIGSLHFRATHYINDASGTLQCHKCYSLTHLAKACESERLCRRCGGPHLVKECTSPAACLNCGEEHEATHPSCSKIAEKKERKETKTLTYAAAAKRAGDKIEMLQLAGCIASCIVAYNMQTASHIDQGEIYKDVAKSVSATYRVSLRATHVKAQALQVADPSAAANHD